MAHRVALTSRLCWIRNSLANLNRYWPSNTPPFLLIYPSNPALPLIGLALGLTHLQSQCAWAAHVWKPFWPSRLPSPRLLFVNLPSASTLHCSAPREPNCLSANGRVFWPEPEDPSSLFGPGPKPLLLAGKFPTLEQNNQMPNMNTCQSLCNFNQS